MCARAAIHRRPRASRTALSRSRFCSAKRRRCVGLLLSIAFIPPFACTSCGKPQSVEATESTASEPGHGVADEGADPRYGPAETVRRAHARRLAGDFLGLEAYLIEEQRVDVNALIRATDQLVAAEAGFRKTVTRRLGHAAAARVDRSDAGDAIGVFSRRVEVIDERIDDDRATVMIQIAGRVPLETVALVRRDGRWLIQTDPPIPGVAERMQELAEVLLAMARRVERGDVTDATLNEELASQQAPVLRKLHALSTDRGS